MYKCPECNTINLDDHAVDCTMGIIDNAASEQNWYVHIAISNMTATQAEAIKQRLVGVIPELTNYSIYFDQLDMQEVNDGDNEGNEE